METIERRQISSGKKMEGYWCTLKKDTAAGSWAQKKAPEAVVHPANREQLSPVHAALGL